MGNTPVGSTNSAALDFQLPMTFTYVASVLWAMSGALTAARRGYDIAGLIMLAIICSIGGGLIRDGIFINNGPPQATKDAWPVLLAVGVAGIVWIAGKQIMRIKQLDFTVDVIDAIGSAAYGLVGLQLCLAAGLSLPASVFVGVINGVGGGVIRDIMVNQEVTILKPGALSAIAVLIGLLTFLPLFFWLHMPAPIAGWISIGVGFATRGISLIFGIRTKPAFSDATRAGSG